MPGAVSTYPIALKHCAILKDPHDEGAVYYDAKFYPYSTNDPIFAVTGRAEVIVCRPRPNSTGELDKVMWLRDEDGASLNSVTWSQDPVTHEPLLCVAGAGEGRIKVLKVQTGELVQTLVGHGGAIQDLVTSPLDPSIIASSSADQSIRIWNLRSGYRTYPCLALFGGGGAGHQEDILTLAFHSSGRFLLSGGHDNIVNLWVVPSLESDPSLESPKKIVFPHFSSRELHSAHVDCVKFYGDLILSRSSSENKIFLWSINGFNSGESPDPYAGVPPKVGQETRSAFGNGFQRLMTLNTPRCNWIWMRFGLLQQLHPHRRPLLVMGSEAGYDKHDFNHLTFYIWDLHFLEESLHKYKASASGVAQQFNLGSTNGSNADSLGASRLTQANLKLEPFEGLPAHYEIKISSKKVGASRAIDWSPDGKWCVAVGDHAFICILESQPEHL